MFQLVESKAVKYQPASLQLGGAASSGDGAWVQVARSSHADLLEPRRCDDGPGWPLSPESLSPAFASFIDDLLLVPSNNQGVAEAGNPEARVMKKKGSMDEAGQHEFTWSPDDWSIDPRTLKLSPISVGWCKLDPGLKAPPGFKV